MKIDETGKPMMSDKDIRAIEKVIGNIKEPMCLEWGSGNSTIYFPDKCSESIGLWGRWISVEHNGHYVDYLMDKIDHYTVTMVWVQDPADYIDCVKKYQNHFDFILIDGEQREKCLEEAMSMIKSTGVVLLHDSGRKDYSEFIKKYPKREVLTKGEIPEGEFFVHQGLTAFYK